MSCAVALAHASFQVTLLEKRATLGGRAGSFFDAASHQWIDNCQHVLMPCCTNLLDFYTRIGAQDKVRFHSRIPFVSRDGQTSFLRATRLPAPFHLASSFLSLHFLSHGDKLRIARGLARLLTLSRRSASQPVTAGEWLQANGQTRKAITGFWEPVLVSALNETVDRISLHYAAMVFLEAFLKSPAAWWLGVPSVPLSELYGRNYLDALEARGGQVRLQSEVERLLASGGNVSGVVLRGGEILAADLVVLALPWHAAGRLLQKSGLAPLPRHPDQLLEASPITGVHLWFDRTVTPLDFAVLPEGEVQWFFNKTRNYGSQAAEGTYLQLVTSASHAWLERTKPEILEIALGEIRAALPATREAGIVKALVLKEPMATFSPKPGCEQARPGARSGMPNLYLAGDWLQTGWPATMEGAVRGGYLAAEAILEDSGSQGRILVRELPPSGFMRLHPRFRSPAGRRPGAGERADSGR